MRLHPRILFSVLSFCLLASTSPLSGLSSTPLPPSQDPWYSAPPELASSQPGSVLKIRIAPGNLTTVFNESSAVYNILFRTTNSLYAPAWAVTTLFVPKLTNGSALLSYQIPTDSADPDAAPSYSLYAPVTPLASTGTNDIHRALRLGWYVNIPDFEGPQASFTDGVQSGHAVLDSVRSVLHLRFGLTENARYAMWGYSGGSIGSEWAAELQAQYAPELDFAGAALGGLVPNVSSALSAISGTRWAGLFPEMLLGITSQSPEARRHVVSQLKTEGLHNRTTFLSAANLPIENAFEKFNNQDMYQYFKLGRRFFLSPMVQEVLDRKGTMGFHGIPKMPLFVYKAIADEIAHTNETDALVNRYCGVQANILYERNTIGGHLAEQTNGDGRAFEWLSEVLGGHFRHTGCTVENVTISIADSPL